MKLPSKLKTTMLFAILPVAALFSDSLSKSGQKNNQGEIGSTKSAKDHSSPLDGDSCGAPNCPHPR